MTKDEADTIRKVWADIRTTADFTRGNYWRAVERPTLPRFATIDVEMKPEPTVLYGFQIRELEGSPSSRAVFGRREGSDEWLPVEQLPR